jgi:DNA-binding MarR family transcriptional regulator
LKYIADTFGIEVTKEPWEANLPFYLLDGYTFQSVKLEDTPCLFLKPKGNLPALNTVKKHLVKIAEISGVPLVLEIEALNARQRKALIAARIPFVADGVQLYLPFIGAALQERYSVSKPQGNVLMPTSQRILFHYIYRKERDLYASGLAELLGVSAMQITRAVTQLVALSLCTMRKDGVQIVLTGTEYGAALFEIAKPHLHNPVYKKRYIEKDMLPQGLPFSGVSALAGYTMLNPPNLETYAFSGKVGELKGMDTLVDADTQVEVEFWRYSPTTLSAKDGFADPLSLWVTLQETNIRMEIAKDELLAEIMR